ncbi:phosphotransferase family protein [Nocardia brasiliensis]|uniref:Phosphotransferase n=1 Tax=Nocardia brasiliensis (strain ATCC 700358 / HUJEG-1) TaxID=1133849 RepID=K0ENL9_NOCB7|nr:phosphotransferase [Nocardia brasiliensis ATCC 700358]OCF88808.1 phosphotransferase [Nocardia brasiliensis]
MDAVIEEHRELLEGVLPGARVSELTVREGQFHYLVIGADRVVCLARTAAAAARLPLRAAALRAVAGLELVAAQEFRGHRPSAPSTGVSCGESLCELQTTSVNRPRIAVPRLVDVSDDPPYLVMTRVSGEPLAATVLRDVRAAESVARQCHALLSALSAAGADQHSALPTTPADRWTRFADDVRAELYPLMKAAGRARADRELAALGALPHRTEAVVHGDLGGENLLWDNETHDPILCGVVDWDGVCLGDPAEDFAAIAASYGERVLDTILRMTAPADDLAVRIATIRGTFALQQALDAHRDGDADELADGLTGYR